MVLLLHRRSIANCVREVAAEVSVGVNEPNGRLELSDVAVCDRPPSVSMVFVITAIWCMSSEEYQLAVWCVYSDEEASSVLM